MNGMLVVTNRQRRRGWHLTLALMVISALSACASVPLSTLVKMSQFGPEQFVALDSDAIRAKVSVEQAVGLKPEETKLEVTLSGPGGELHRTFNFELVSETPRTESRWLGAPRHWIDYQLKLTPEAQTALREFQAFTANDPQLEDFSVSVNARTKNRPAAGDTLRISIALKLYPDQDYMPLFENAEVVMGDSQL